MGATAAVVYLRAHQPPARARRSSPSPRVASPVGGRRSQREQCRSGRVGFDETIHEVPPDQNTLRRGRVCVSPERLYSTAS